MAVNLHSIEFWTVALTATVTLLAGFSAFARWCSGGLAVPQKKLEDLRVGMTTEEVTALLGHAREAKRTDLGGELWTYGARMKRHVLRIDFDSSGRLVHFVHGIPDMRREGRIRED